MKFRAEYTRVDQICFPIIFSRYLFGTRIIVNATNSKKFYYKVIKACNYRLNFISMDYILVPDKYNMTTAETKNIPLISIQVFVYCWFELL